MKRQYRQFINLDAESGVFFENELEHMKARTYDVIYPELLARRLFPVDSSADPGDETISYETWDHVGMAKLLHTYAQDLPNVEVTAKKTTRNIYGEGVAFGYSIQDIRAAQKSGKPLSQRKMDAARRQLLQLENKIAFYGNSANGVPGTDIPGFINNPNVNAVTIPQNGGATSTLWVNKTAAEIINDINLMCSAIRTVSNGVEFPRRLILPEAQYTLIATEPSGVTISNGASNANTTILQYVLQSNPFVEEILPVYELAGAAPSGAWDGNDCMILYDPSPDKLTLEVPQDVEFFPVQEKGLMYEVPAHMRTAGVIIYYPKSIAQGNGI